jgi:hypothetical protein
MEKRTIKNTAEEFLMWLNDIKIMAYYSHLCAKDTILLIYYIKNDIIMV